jgi:DNA polymerase III epsilon subunit-like protein
MKSLAEEDNRIMLPAIIDIEASGFGRNSYPIEVGIVLPDQKSFCNIIRPADEWTYWDDSAEAVHGITRELLLKKGKPPHEVADKLNQLLQGTKIYTDAWSHDISWIGKLYDLTDIPQLFSLDSLRSLMTEQQAALWHPTKEQVISELHLVRHRASTDALILQETFRRTAAAGTHNP